MFTRKIALLMIVFIVAMSFASAPLAQAGNPAQQGKPPRQEFRSGDGAFMGTRSTEEARATLRQIVSTREGRMSAQPMPYQGGRSTSAPSLDKPAGAPGFVPGHAPRADAKTVAQVRYPEAWQARGQQTVSLDPFKGLTEYGTAGKFSSYATNYWDVMWTDYPWMDVGRLYVLDGISVFTCTATLIGYNVIVTAAHCAFNTDYDYWYDAWLFVPAESDYYDPFGMWDGDLAWFPTEWVSAKYSSAGMRYDLAVITLPFDDGGGWYVSDYVGWMGYTYNLSSKEEYHAIGYPSSITYPVDGDAFTYTCAAESFQKGRDVLGMGCDMMVGSDGGPWIYKFVPYFYDIGDYVGAVTAGGIYGRTWGNTFYGPKFRSTNIVPLCALAGC